MKKQLTKQELNDISEAIAYVLNSKLMNKYEENGEVYYKVNQDVANDPNFDILDDNWQNK